MREAACDGKRSTISSVAAVSGQMSSHRRLLSIAENTAHRFSSQADYVAGLAEKGLIWTGEPYTEAL